MKLSTPTFIKKLIPLFRSLFHSRRGILAFVLMALITTIVIIGLCWLVKAIVSSSGNGGNGSSVASGLSADTTLSVDNDVAFEIDNYNVSLPDLTTTAYLEDIVLTTSANYLYGLATHDYEVRTSEIESGETFSKLLNGKYNVNITVVNKLIDMTKGKFDLRDMRAGNSYTALLSNDTLSELQYLIYDKSLSEYVVFSVADSLSVKVGKKNVNTKERYAEGVINSSLYATMYETGLNPVIASRLSEIFKWSIDFFALQKGDSFKIVYQEQFIDTTSIGIGRIYGAEFTHGGKEYWAVRFQQGDEAGYWDMEGKNLRKNFLRAPLSFQARISSRFGMRVHPITRIRRPHNGVDYACPVGTPVMAVADGVVKRKYFERGGGNTVRIKHDQGLESGYLHLSRFGKGISVGSRVRQGQIIGYVGSTGMSTGPHLDFRIWKGGRPIDPLKMPSLPTNPINSKYRGEFNTMKKDLMDVMTEYAGTAK